MNINDFFFKLNKQKHFYKNALSIKLRRKNVIYVNSILLFMNSKEAKLKPIVWQKVLTTQPVSLVRLHDCQI